MTYLWGKIASFGCNLAANPSFSVALRRTFQTSSTLRNYFNVQDEDDFKERVLKAKNPVIVDFFATWCGPCKLLDPRLKAAVADFEDKVSLAKVDIDDLQDLAIHYGVSSVPTVMAMNGGNVTDKFIGLADEDKIKSFINKAINNAKK